MTMLAQQQGQSVVSLETFPLSWRIGNAAMAYVKYLLESLYPVNLAVIYPLPREMAWGQVATAIILLAVITWLVWRARVSRPYLLTGWFWYLGMLVPVIGLVQVGLQAMADRYTYLSFIGIFVGAVFGLGALANQLRLKPIVTIPVASIVLAGCLWVTAGQLRYWRNSETLFEHAVAVTKDNPIAEDSLGAALGEAGQLPGAIQHLRAALRLKPAFIELVKTHNNLGNFLLRTGQPQEAIEHFQEALRLKPDFAPAYNNLGAALAQTGQSQEAIDQFREALRLKPGWAMARNNLGDALIKSGQVLFQKGQMNQAIASLQEGLQIHPGNVGACNCLGYIFLSRGQAGEAAAYFQQVLESQPNDIGAQNNLAWVLATCPDASLRNGVKAVELAQQANQLSGGQNPALLDTLAAAYAEAGNFPEAVTTAQKALQLIEPQTNAASAVNDLRRQLKCYQAGSPYRDRSLTNTQAATYPNP